MPRTATDGILIIPLLLLFQQSRVHSSCAYVVCSCSLEISCIGAKTAENSQKKQGDCRLQDGPCPDRRGATAGAGVEAENEEEKDDSVSIFSGFPVGHS